MKKILSCLLMLIFLIALPQDVDAQKKRRKKRTEKTEDSERRKRDTGEEEEYNGFSSKLVYDINIGNIALSNGYFGLSFKPAVGYKLHKRATVGLGIKYFYNLLSNREPNLHLNDYGAFAYSRLKITETIFAHLEYSSLSFDNEYFFDNKRKNIIYPLIGGGYTSGFGDWKGILTVLFILDEEVRNLGQYPIEFWFGFSKNF